MKKNKFKYINDFPVIIFLAVATLIIILATIYLSFKPYGTIYRNGYMVLSNNMTYNLVNNNLDMSNLEVGVAPVNNGDYIYRQVDSYYVGLEEKKEIDYDYPIYSTDGLTIYSINENTTLIDSSFDKLKGYSGISLNFGILYNDLNEQVDDIDYIFLSLNNSVFINLQSMSIKTLSSEYNIPINSPIYFGLKYINYYVFDGESFKYNRINDIYYDSIIRIGNTTLTYEEFLNKMNLVKETQEEIKPEENKPDIKDPIDEEPKEEYVKPSVDVSEFIPSVYGAASNLKINDPVNRIVSYPTFEIYTMDEKLYSRKKVSNNGDFKLSGLSSNTEYKVIGTYKYKNEKEMTIVSTFYEGTFKTNSIDELNSIKVLSNIGERYSNKIELKDVEITNTLEEAVVGIKKIVFVVYEDGNNESKEEFSISYSELSNILKGIKTTISTTNKLLSNTVYNYELNFYDRDNNELKAEGNIKGTIKTSKAKPSINYSIKLDKSYNSANISVTTKNTDNIYIKDYKYELYTLDGYFVTDGELDYENNYKNNLVFEELDYNTNYILKISGLYDLEDGKGTQEFVETKEFTTVNLKDNFTAWYDDDTTLVTHNSIRTEIYIGSNTPVLEKATTRLLVYLTDKNGEDIQDDNGNLKYVKSYSKEEYTNANPYSAYYVDTTFEGLESITEYTINLRIDVKQMNDVISIYKKLSPSITTTPEDAFIEIINKQLIGDYVDLSFRVNDPDKLIDNDEIIVEVYEGNFLSVNDITNKYVYRNIYDISESDEVNLFLEGYNSDNYTILIKANSYKKSRLPQILNIKNNNEFLEVINVDRNITSNLEMFEQLYTDNTKKSLNTKINLTYNLGENQTNIYAVDCTNGNCRNLGYINSDNEFISNSNNYNMETLGIQNNLSIKNRITIKNTVTDSNHKFYLVLEKPGTNIKTFQSFSEKSLNNELYVLSSLEYSTNYEIYNIDEASDFYNTTLIRTSKETRHYVVTSDIDFNSYLTSYRFSNFNGTIDFQGYSVNLYKNSNSGIILFNSIGESAVIKNAVLNYNLDHDGVLTTMPGFIDTNNGTINNIIVNVNQANINGRAYALGLLCYSNYGIIDGFVVYLKSDIHTYSASSLVTYINYATGIIKNGYVATDPNQVRSRKIILHDTSAYHGTFAETNNGTITNVYNLIDVVSAEENYTGSGIGTITRVNNGIVKNAISIASATQKKDDKNGPSVYNGTGGSGNSGTGKVENNFYVDTNINNISYDNKFNQRINISSLINKNTWEIILNSDRVYSILSGFYPTLKMNDFMNFKQEKIAIPYDYKLNSLVDILSVEALKDNLNETAQAKIIVSNPNKLEITDILIDDLTPHIISSTYDESLQATILILDLSLEKDTDIAKSQYSVVGIEYVDALGGNQVKNYSENETRYLQINMYRSIGNYEDLIIYINKNENISLNNNITISTTNTSGLNLTNLPSNSNYSSIFDGREKTIDFNNYIINRGYFFYNVSGTIKNLEIKNLNINTEANSIGFIRYTSYSTIENIDITNERISIYETKEDTGSIYVGGLIAQTSYAIVNKVSVNNLELTRQNKEDNNGIIYYNYNGGIIGYMDHGSIMNSYVYNLNINNLYIDVTRGSRSIGGIVGYASFVDVFNNYSKGTIDTEYTNVGGIVGISNRAYIKNNYSYVDITSTGDYVGGILGILSLGHDSSNNNTVMNNMFLGKINNINDSVNVNYSLIVPMANSDYVSNNFTLINETNFSKVIQITKDELIRFDENRAFSQINGNSLPHLKESSFIQQQISNEYLGDLSIPNINYDIVYEQNSCKKDIYNINNQTQVINSDLYNFSCSTYAILNIDNNLDQIESIDNTLIIEKLSDNSYKLKPNNKYLNSYKISINGKDINLDLKFYRQITDKDDFKKISNDYNENIILKNDLKFSDADIDNQDIYNKKINNLLGNGYTVSSDIILNNTLISKLSGVMRDINFSNISISKPNTEYLSLIKSNEGLIENCLFSNITINSNSSFIGIISMSSGRVNNVKLSNISVTGKNYIGSLIAYDNDKAYNQNRVSNVKANEIKLYGSEYIGGIVGYANYSLNDISVENLLIGYWIDQNNSNKVMYPTNHIGGIIGKGDCLNNCSIKDGIIYATGNYIGGIGGEHAYYVFKRTNSSVENVTITDTIPNITPKTSSYIGGMYGFSYYFTNDSVDNLKIGTEDNGVSGNYVKFSGSHVGGLSGYPAIINDCEVRNSLITGIDNVGGLSGKAYYSRNSIVDNTIVHGNNNVGGLMGISYSGVYETQGNILSNSTVIANSDNVGGIYGLFSDTNWGTLNIRDNIILKTNIIGNNNVGGVIGNINNSTTFLQNLKFTGNLVEDVTVSSNSDSGYAGGIIGRLYQIPSAVSKTFNYNLFYGNLSNNNCEGCSLVGNIVNTNTGSSSIYGDGEINIQKFSKENNFKRYVLEVVEDPELEINSISKLNTFIQDYNTTTFTSVKNIDGINYFPVFKDPNYSIVNTDDYVEIPYDADTGFKLTMPSTPKLKTKMLRNYSLAYNNKINTNYNVYASDVNKINIEFTNIDINNYFYYEIGNYKSEYIPITKKVYTLTYDFKNSIKIYITNGINYKEEIIEASSIAKTVSLVNDEAYYIKNNQLYNESKLITGSFVNIYGSRALNSDGEIYNIESKEVSRQIIDYSLLDYSIPIYTTNYNGQNINTYYNYSTVNEVEMDYQIFVKNNNINIIDSSIQNKKDNYIIDYYNNSEFQIILKEDKKLYSLKHNINYPSSLINKDIIEMYTNINSSSTIAVLKYSNGMIYKFNYRTGEELFNSNSKKYSNFFDYAKYKLSGNSYNEIKSISNYNKYTEIEILKDKITDINISEASNKIYGNSNISSSKGPYVTVYNGVTNNYDLFELDNLLTSVNIESENNKIYKDYELVKFYSTSNKKTSNNKLNGIIIFACSILSIITALFILYKLRKNKRGEI